MISNVNQSVLDQLDSVISDYGKLKAIGEYDDLSNCPWPDLQQFLTRASACIERVACKSSPYFQQINDILASNNYLGNQANLVIGVVRALRADVEAGFIKTIEELIHGDVFSDFLEMADYLLGEGYKDAAAVIAGSTLEAHLRQLCARHNLPVESQTASGLRPTKSDTLNADLARSNAYSKLDQKNVTAWLDLRNKAAHGHYSEYQKDQVQLIIAAIRDFMTRIRA